MLRSTHISTQAGEALRSAATNGLAARFDPSQVRIEVTQTPKSTVFDLVALGPSPGYTQQFLEALMNEYLAYKRSIHESVAGAAEGSISKQVRSYETEKIEKERALNAFQSTNEMAVLEEEAKGAGVHLANLRSRLSEYQLERKILEANALERAASHGLLTNQAMGMSDYLPGMTTPGATQIPPQERFNAQRQLEVFKSERARLAVYLRPKHPKMIKLDSQIEQTQRLVDVLRQQNEDQQAALLKANQMKIDDVQAEISKCELRVTAASRLLAKAEQLKREADSAQTVYEQTRQLLRRAEMGSSVEQEALTILEHACPAQCSHRQEILLMTLAALAGLAAGLGIVFVVAVRDDRFNSVAEVKRQLQERIVGQVPEVASAYGEGRIPLLEIEDQRQTYAESYRNLRSALLFLTPIREEHPHTLLITSATAEEGKSTIAANLARTLAMGGAQVLLMDADLRCGALHKTLGMERLPGLAEVLHQPDTLAGAIQSEASPPSGGPLRSAPPASPDSAQPQLLRSHLLPNLSFLARGGDVRNPGDLLLSPALDQILARLREQFDYVLIDSCPVFAADDVTTLAPKVDGTLLVVRNGFSRFSQVREALDLLYQRQARILGLVFNRTDARARSYYYYTHSKYHART